MRESLDPPVVTEICADRRLDWQSPGPTILGEPVFRLTAKSLWPSLWQMMLSCARSYYSSMEGRRHQKWVYWRLSQPGAGMFHHEYCDGVYRHRGILLYLFIYQDLLIMSAGVG